MAFNATATLHRLPAAKRPQFSVIVDKAHLFSRGPVLGAMLSQLRKFGAAPTLCTQAPSRLGELVPDVLTNCATVLAMQLPNARPAPSPTAPETRSLYPPSPNTTPPSSSTTLANPTPHRSSCTRYPGSKRTTSAPTGCELARRRVGRTEHVAPRADLDRLAALADGVSDMIPPESSWRRLALATDTRERPEGFQALVHATLRAERR